jgi:hypothetical protein
MCRKFMMGITVVITVKIRNPQLITVAETLKGDNIISCQDLEIFSSKTGNTYNIVTQ